MARTLVAIFLLVALTPGIARAEDVAVRVTAEAQPMQHAGVQVLEAKEPPVFDRRKWAPAALTDGSGQAVVDVPAGGSVMVYAPGYELAIVAVDRLPLDVALRPERVVSGRVLDSAGKPVAGAEVELWTTFRKEATLSAATDAKGRFRFYGAWLDDYTVHARKDGFLDSMERAFDSGDEIALARPAILSGKIRNAGGKPLPGVKVQSDRAGSVESGKDGAFSFDLHHPGATVLTVLRPFVLTPLALVLKDGEKRTDLDLVALEPATLVLRVLDEQEQPLAGARLGNEVSAADGTIRLPFAPGTEETLSLSKPGYLSQEIALGPERASITRSLGDRVLVARKQVDVLVRQPDGKLAVAGTVGEVALKDGKATVPQGRYAVMIPGFPIMAVDADPPGPVRVMLPEAHWLSGLVVDAQHRPVAGASVYVGGEFVTSDNEGRFRAGPFAEPKVEVFARKEPLVSASFWVRISDGELVVTLHGYESELVSGSVSRAGRPVVRFFVGDQQFLDEDGRFEVLVQRAVRSWLEFQVDGQFHRAPLPPRGEALVFRLPEGRVRVGFHGTPPEPREQISLSRPGFHRSDYVGDDGTVAFGDLERGIYFAKAPGYERLEIRVGDGDAGRVLLKPVPTATLDFELPAGMREQFVSYPRRLPLGTHTDVSIAFGADCWLRVPFVRLREPGEISFDLSGSGRVTILGHAGDTCTLERRTQDIAYVLEGELNRDGRFAFPAVALGTYTMRCGAVQRTIDVAPGAMEISFARGQAGFRGRVLLGQGPAQGAKVRLQVGERVIREVVTDLSGGFQFKDLAFGRYTCRASYTGHATGSATLVVSADGVAAEGFPITLPKSAGVPVRLLGRMGEPLAQVRLRVDGDWRQTNALGVVLLDRVPTSLDLDLAGYASLRDFAVVAGRTIRLERGAALTVHFDRDLGSVAVRIAGREWSGPLRRGLPPVREGRLDLSDLPPGPVEVVFTPADEEQEPEIVQTTLDPDEPTDVDFRGR